MVQEMGKISVKFIPQVAIDRKNPQSLDFVLDAVAKLIESLVKGVEHGLWYLPSSIWSQWQLTVRAI